MLHCLFKLLLGAKLGRVSALPLPAVGGLGGEAGVALAADALLAVEFPGKHGKGGVVDATTEPEHEVERGLLLDIVVREGPAVLELLSGENQTLLIRGDTLLVLDLRLDIVDRVAGLHVERDGLTREGLDKDLHGSIDLLSSVYQPAAMKMR